MEPLTYRYATEADLPFLDRLADEDGIGAARDNLRPDHAEQALEGLRAINTDPNHALYIVEQHGEPVGSFQLSFLPGVSRRGAWRGQIESVRVLADWRGEGIGEAMMRWAVERCKERGCGIVQLTSDRQRGGAHRFYERLGFVPTHTGFKLTLG
ncbi:GNAT family N-acetyltransferase [Erythrobacter sp. EC-HK427]|uniref:GNAT family N-acetyltransferase n=1 Tax=Erythrobacter sp. EC-HK427 TaxID=2038396 RepID=UPI001259778A|nr:GNAT family N-acetyltransferase [Erythrobacter sp. EC-HK427]VVT19055.1 GNAT family acetyltransferase [Erythrobacter sp. EC-HK427]